MTAPVITVPAGTPVTQIAQMLRRHRVSAVPVLDEASVVDPAAYRSRAEAGRLRAVDPVAAFRARLLEAGVLGEEAALRIEEEADQQVTAAVTYADDSPDRSAIRKVLSALEKAGSPVAAAVRRVLRPDDDYAGPVVSSITASVT